MKAASLADFAVVQLVQKILRVTQDQETLEQ
jgi:hypothetical protein